MAIRIIVADDHPFVLLGVQSMLKMHAGVKFVGEAATPAALFSLLQHAPCDVLVTDLSMPDPSGVIEDPLSLIRRIRHAWPQLRIVVMTMLTDTSLLREIVAEGAVIALSKTTSMDELWQAIEASAKGVPYCGRTFIDTRANSQTGRGERDEAPFALRLSPRQVKVVQMFVGGQSIAEIAAALGCHRRTVSRQKREAMMRLGVTSNPGLFFFVHTQLL
jgi:two-component system, NarL family, captular synthesis response regulator RcsB